jgi:hypothetical protein
VTCTASSRPPQDRRRRCRQPLIKPAAVSPYFGIASSDIEVKIDRAVNRGPPDSDAHPADTGMAAPFATLDRDPAEARPETHSTRYFDFT